MGLSSFLQGFAGGWNDPLYALHRAQSDQIEQQRRDSNAARGVFGQMQNSLPSGGVPAQQGDAIGQLIAQIAPETQPTAAQQFQSALYQLAQADPGSFATPALNYGAPPKPLTPLEELDSQLKGIQISNAQADNDLKKMEVKNRQRGFDMMQGLFNGTNAAPSQAGAPSGGSALGQMASLNTPQAVNETASRATALQQLGTPPTVAAMDMPASPAQMASGISRMGVSPQPSSGIDAASMASAPQQVTVSPPPAATASPLAPEAQAIAQARQQIVPQQATAQTTATPDSLSPQQWLGTQAGQDALAVALASGDVSKFYDAHSKYIQDTIEQQRKERSTVPEAAKMQQGRRQFSDALDEMDTVLEEMLKKGFTSSINGSGINNVMANIGNSNMPYIGGGQTMERLAGTDRGRLQQKFEAAKAHLVGLYKNASGTTGGQMNSVPELDQFMKGLPVLTNTYEANKDIIGELRGLYGSPSNSSPDGTSVINTSAGPVTIRRVQ